MPRPLRCLCYQPASQPSQARSNTNRHGELARKAGCLQVVAGPLSSSEGRKATVYEMGNTDDILGSPISPACPSLQIEVEGNIGLLDDGLARIRFSALRQQTTVGEGLRYIQAGKTQVKNSNSFESLPCSRFLLRIAVKFTRPCVHSTHEYQKGR